MIVKNVFIAWFWLRFNEILRCDTVNTSTVFLLELYNAYTCNRRWFNFLKYGRWGYADYTYIKLFGFYIIAGFSKVGSNSVIKALGYLFFFFCFMRKISTNCYPSLKFLICQATYLCEQTFSFYASAKTKCRNRWSVENVMRLQVTLIMSDFEKVYRKASALKSLILNFIFWK